MKLQGTLTALTTPFNESGEVDYDSFARHCAHQIENGVSGLVVLGTTGEAPTVEPHEREKLIAAAHSASKGRVPVIVGVGTNSTKKSIEQAKSARDANADMLLIAPPYYNKPTQEGIYRHYMAIAEEVDLPIIIYNIKGRTAVNIETPTLLRLAKNKQFVAVKEASGDIGQMAEVIAAAPEGFSVISGDDALTVPLMALGGTGVISVVSNLFPRKVSDMTSAALKGDFAAARAIHYELMPFVKVAFIETNPIPIKTAMNLCGWHGGHFRLPMCEMQPHNEEKLKAVLKEMKVLK